MNQTAMNQMVGRDLTIKAVLMLGFGTCFGLWVVAGYNFTQRIADMQREAAAIDRRYTQAQELLSSVRAQVLLGSLSVRDALLDPDSDAVHTYRRQVVETYGNVDRALREYVPILDPGAERDRVNGLRREIDAFRSTLLDVLDSDRARWRSQARLILGLVMPRRTSVMQLSDNIQTLNRSTFVQHQQAITVVYARMQRQVWQTLGFAVVASLGIALFATVCVGRLERDLQQKRLKERQTTEDLQRLSTKLVSAQEEERRTIARELHDEIGQVLMAIKVELTLAQRRLDTAGVHGRLLDDAQSITDGALVTVRDLSHLLHPAVLDDFGLSAALESYVTGFTRRYDIPVEMLHDGVDERLLPEIEAGVYRIVQEALTNVAKHANATMGVVYLRCAGNVLHVSIEDDGVGFEPDGPRRGLGLIGIRERVAHLEGTVRIDSAPCRGTRLSIEVPARTRVRVPAPHELDVANSAVPLTPGEVLLG